MNPYRERRQFDHGHKRGHIRIGQHLVILVENFIEIGQLWNTVAADKARNYVKQEPGEPVAAHHERIHLVFYLYCQGFYQRWQMNDLSQIYQLIN